MTKKRTLEEKLAQRLSEPNIIYLLGAGSTFCAGLPGIIGLTKLVRTKLKGQSNSVFDEIVATLEYNKIENPNIEDTLSELQHQLSGISITGRDKKRYTTTFIDICQCILESLYIDNSTEYHRQFIQRVVNRRNAEPAKRAPPVQIFMTNYDLLIEFACEETQVVVINGFEGIFSRRWNPISFDYDIGKATSHVRTPRFVPSSRHIRLYKLHGSISWYEENGQFYEEKPILKSVKKPLIIYPSRLKYSQSIRPPFEWLFRKLASAISDANLLVCIGYRFADEHLNQLIFNGLNNNLSLLVLSKEPVDSLSSKSTHPSINIINEEYTIFDGKNQNQITDLWDFQKFAMWLPALKGG